MDPVRDGIIAELTPAQRLGFLSVLFRVAQADKVSTTERDHLKPLLAWFRAPEDEVTEAMRQAYDHQVSLGDMVSGMRASSAGILLFRECCAVVWSDGSKSHSEAQFLDELAEQLTLSEASRQVLDSPLACSPEGERRFLLHLNPNS